MPFVGIVDDIRDNFLTVNFGKKSIVHDFHMGDPMVAAFLYYNKMFVRGCNINRVFDDKPAVELILDVEEQESQKRVYDRYPTSHFANIKCRDGGRRFNAVIKDMSNYGLLIYSDADLEAGALIEVNAFLDDKIIFLDALIVRKFQLANYTGYGVSISGSDIQSVNEIKMFLKSSQEEYIKRLNIELSKSAGSTDAVYEVRLDRDLSGYDSSKVLDEAARRLDTVIRRWKT